MKDGGNMITQKKGLGESSIISRICKMILSVLLVISTLSKSPKCPNMFNQQFGNLVILIIPIISIKITPSPKPS